MRHQAEDVAALVHDTGDPGDRAVRVLLVTQDDLAVPLELGEQLVVERTDTPFTTRCEPGQELSIPVKNGEGCWFADEELLAELEARGQIALRYAANPNGSVGDVAGVFNADGNVFGLMPHPEHAVDPLLGSTDGALLLGSLVDAARLSVAVPA